jgi:hypothetical protein
MRSVIDVSGLWRLTVSIPGRKPTYCFMHSSGLDDRNHATECLKTVFNHMGVPVSLADYRVGFDLIENGYSADEEMRLFEDEDGNITSETPWFLVPDPTALSLKWTKYLLVQ